MGNSLIETARINRFVSDLGQYEVATNQFKNKFKKYPGDSQFFTPPGNGDNVLDKGANAPSDCAAAPNLALSNYEYYQFWAHLSQSKMLKTNYPAFSSQDDCGGTHSNEDLSSGKIAPYTLVDPLFADAAGVTGDRYSIFPNKNPASSNLSFVFNTLPKDALALENKLGVKAFDNSGKQVGLTNYYGVNTCDGPLLCSDPSAVAGFFYYYIDP